MYNSNKSLENEIAIIEETKAVRSMYFKNIYFNRKRLLLAKYLVHCYTRFKVRKLKELIQCRNK